MIFVPILQLTLLAAINGDITLGAMQTARTLGYFNLAPAAKTAKIPLMILLIVV